MIRDPIDYIHPDREPDITFITTKNDTAITHKWWLLNQVGGITHFAYTTTGFGDGMITRGRLSPEGLFYHHPARHESKWEKDNEQEIAAHLNKFLTKVDNILIGDDNEC